MDLLNANILIAHINWLDKAKELNVKKDSSNYKVVIKNKQFLIDSFRPKKDLEEVGEHMLEWPMFHNLFQRKDFKEAFMKKLKSKKKDKIPIYQMLVAIAEGRDKDCISLLKQYLTEKIIKQLFLVLKKLPIEANQSSDKKDRVKLF